MARAAIETAIWDLLARRDGVPLWKVLGGVQQEIQWSFDRSCRRRIRRCSRKIEIELEAGYQRIKIKIKPGRDYDMVKAVRKEYPDIALTGGCEFCVHFERRRDAEETR